MEIFSGYHLLYATGSTYQINLILLYLNVFLIIKNLGISFAF
jgi:hypothetical protein